MAVTSRHGRAGDWKLIEQRGDVRAATGESEGALADWRRAHELEPENLGSIYSTAFLFEREGRPEEAIAAWRYIVEWSPARGNDLDVEWPTREIERPRGEAAAAREAPAEPARRKGRAGDRGRICTWSGGTWSSSR